MAQVLVPGAGSCPDKVGAEIALGQYSAVATWSGGWSHLRGSTEERTRRSSCVPWEVRLPTAPSPLCRAGRDPLLPAGPHLPSHLLPLPAPAHQLAPCSLAPGQSQGSSLPLRLMIPKGGWRSHLSPFFKTQLLFMCVPPTSPFPVCYCAPNTFCDTLMSPRLGGRRFCVCGGPTINICPGLGTGAWR